MNTYHQHITSLLFLIFIIPVIYQPIHVLSHHKQDHIKKVGCCIVEESHECAICNFEYTSLHTNNVFTKPFINRVYLHNVESMHESCCLFNSSSHQLLRAPPCRNV